MNYPKFLFYILCLAHKFQVNGCNFSLAEYYEQFLWKYSNTKSEPSVISHVWEQTNQRLLMQKSLFEANRSIKQLINYSEMFCLLHQIQKDNLMLAEINQVFIYSDDKRA